MTTSKKRVVIYMRLLQGDPWPNDFPLQYLIDKSSNQFGLPTTSELKKLYPDIKFMKIPGGSESKEQELKDQNE